MSQLSTLQVNRIMKALNESLHADGLAGHWNHNYGISI